MDRDANQFLIGSCDVYINSQLAGYTDDQVTVKCDRKIVEFATGIPKIRVVAAVVEEMLSVDFKFMQIDAQVISWAAGNDDTINPDPTSVPGSTTVWFGGKSSLGATATLELRGKFPDTDQRNITIQFFKARPNASFQLMFGSSAYVGIPTTWTAEADTTRVAGKMLGRVMIEKQTKS